MTNQPSAMPPQSGVPGPDQSYPPAPASPSGAKVLLTAVVPIVLGIVLAMVGSVLGWNRGVISAIGIGVVVVLVVLVKISANRAKGNTTTQQR